MGILQSARGACAGLIEIGFRYDGSGWGFLIGNFDSLRYFEIVYLYTVACVYW